MPDPRWDAILDSFLSGDYPEAERVLSSLQREHEAMREAIDRIDGAQYLVDVALATHPTEVLDDEGNGTRSYD